jgi:hypothetical protein
MSLFGGCSTVLLIKPINGFCTKRIRRFFKTGAWTDILKQIEQCPFASFLNRSLIEICRLFIFDWMKYFNEPHL